MKNDLRECQSQIVEQLLQQIQNESNPPIRRLIGRNLAILFSLSESLPLLINTVHHCHQILQTNNEIAHL